MTDGPGFEITVADLAAWRRDAVPHDLLDVREPWEFDMVAVDGSLKIPMGQIVGRTEELSRDRPVVVMCHHGGRSARVTMWLRANGFPQAVNLAGGIDDWAASVDPTLPRY